METYATQKILINKIKTENCDKSFKKLLDDFEPLMKSINFNIKTAFKNTPLDKEDINNVMKYNFHKLVLNFDEERGMEFATYIKRYLTFSMRNYVREFIKPNQKIMNFRAEFEEELMASPIIFANFEENYDEIIKNSNLTEKEEVIVRLIIDNNEITIGEIAVLVNRGEKTVYANKKAAIEKIKNSIHSNI